MQLKSFPFYLITCSTIVTITDAVAVFAISADGAGFVADDAGPSGGAIASIRTPIADGAVLTRRTTEFASWTKEFWRTICHFVGNEMKSCKLEMGPPLKVLINVSYILYK